MLNTIMRKVTLQASQAGTQTYKTTRFPFRKAGGFVLVEATFPKSRADTNCPGQHRKNCGCAIVNRFCGINRYRRPAGRRFVLCIWLLF